MITMCYVHGRREDLNSVRILEACPRLLAVVNTRVAHAAISACLVLAIALQLVLVVVIQPVQA